MDEPKVVLVPQNTHPLLKKNAALKALGGGVGGIIGACTVAYACGWKSSTVLGKLTAGCVLSSAIDIARQTLEDKRDDKPLTAITAGVAVTKGIVSGAVIMSVAILIAGYLNKGNKENG